MNPLLYIIGIAVLVVIVLFAVGHSSPDSVEAEEEKSVDRETTQEMTANLKAFDEENKKHQTPESDVGYYGDK